MKRLLAAVFTVGLLTACGSDSYTPPIQPTPTVPTEPEYPQLIGSFSDLRSEMYVCDDSETYKVQLQINQQQRGDLIGEFWIYLGGGATPAEDKISIRNFSGSVSKAGVVRGRAGTGNDGFGIKLEAIGSDFMSGQGEGVSEVTCQDGSTDRLRMYLILER